MFEKEAEEIAKDIYIHHFDDDVNYPCVLQAITVGVQQGAEFGYNKANEWHFVKDEDYPKDENYVLVSNGKDWTKGFYKDKKWNIISLVGFTKIIAWKEIVLPKEIEK